MNEADDLGRAIIRARGKVVVFLGVVLICITIAGTVMYEVENVDRHFAKQENNVLSPEEEIRFANIEQIKTHLNEQGLAIRDLTEKKKSKFTSIPESMYWAIVTMTTVGYGDIVPTTTAGKFVTAILIMLGYSLIIVPTGFVSAEMVSARQQANRQCTGCEVKVHDRDSVFCKRCGTKLPSL